MSESRLRLEGRHVGVTGAGTGIGEALAHRLAAEGAELSLLARDASRLERVATELRAAHPGRRVRVAACDIRDRAAVDAAVDASVAELGGLFAFVANSGIGGPNEAGAADRFDDLVATNLVGTYSCLRAAERHVADGGRLVAVSSILARIGVPGYTGYCASKAGVLGLVRALACELAPRRVHVNAVCPGWVETQMALDGLAGMAEGMGVSVEEARELAMQAVPLRRMSRPSEVAGLVAWLLSDDSIGVTGQALDQNGGAFML